MKRTIGTMLALSLTLPLLANAATVIKEVPDKTSGRTLGGSLGLMLGGLGGPAGAIAGAAVSAWLGGELQASSCTHGVAYEVRRENGELTTVRSPKRRWESGDEVIIKGNRLFPANAP